MHCRFCDLVLNDFEATRRVKNTHEYIDLCNKCFKASYAPTYPVSERKDLATSKDFDDDLDSEGTIEYYEDIKDFISNQYTND